MCEVDTKADDRMGKEGHREGDDGTHAVDLLIGGLHTAASAGIEIRRQGWSWGLVPMVLRARNRELEDLQTTSIRNR
jgi:hypothetical protein